MSDKSWIYKSRTKYWEIVNAGKRYAALRNIKNKSGDHAGQYTRAAVCSRVEGIDERPLSFLESGAILAPGFVEAFLPLLIADLGITEEEFNTQEKLRAPKQEVASATPPGVETATGHRAQPSSKSKGENSSAVEAGGSRRGKPTEQSSVVVVNHILESFVIVVTGNGEIHLLEDTKENLKKPGSIWVGPADDIGRGAKLRPRTTALK